MIHCVNRFRQLIELLETGFTEQIGGLDALHEVPHDTLAPDEQCVTISEFGGNHPDLFHCRGEGNGLLSFEDIWEEKDIDLETDLAEGIQIESDPELLILVWNNLISNAMKFTDPCGRVTVSLGTAEDFAVVRISDTGCGIPPKVGEHIFEKFYQGDTSHATQGNDLGLALVKRVVDIVGGDISVDSEVGKGSSFSVRIRRKGDETG